MRGFLGGESLSAGETLQRWERTTGLRKSHEIRHGCADTQESNSVVQGVGDEKMVRNSAMVYGSQTTVALKGWSPDQQCQQYLGTY